jgi:hypothetical protein
MKILTLGDIHGKTVWKDIIFGSTENFKRWVKTPYDKEPLPYDKIIFIGDYLDTDSGATPLEVEQNFKDIIQFKKSAQDIVVLLFGNHEWHYLAQNVRYSGYRDQMAISYREILNKELPLFDMAYKLNINGRDFIWSHAGISTIWLRTLYADLEDKIKRIGLDENDLVECLNMALQTIYRGFSNLCADSGGSYEVGSPIWARSSLIYSPLPNTTQIVGHTRVKKVKHYSTFYSKDNATIIKLDCLMTSENVENVNFLVIDTDNLSLPELNAH